MSYIKTEWENREGVNLNKFIKIQETATSVILQNQPDQISKPGTPFSTANMNKIEQGIFDAHDRLDSDYGTLKMLLFQPSAYQMAKMRLLPLQGQVITIAEYQRLCDLMYCGNANNANAHWWYKISNPSDKNSRSVSGAYMVVLDFQGLFPRAAGMNSRYTAANNTPYDGNVIGVYQTDRTRRHSGLIRNRVTLWNSPHAVGYYSGEIFSTSNQGGNETPIQGHMQSTSIASTQIAVTIGNSHETAPASISVFACISY